ncbi:MAG: nucleotide sugar dehydrogenase [Candidatus Omnitrophica bacterium]|nr:nucleotide sugar dehydrogenase [Candidatus Omnitrophota bacterium]
MGNLLKDFGIKLYRKKAGIAVVGLGYVGLPLAIEFAKKGHPVTGIELDRDRLNHIKNKVSYISDVPTADLKQVLRKGTFKATCEFSVLRDIDIILICVPTPLKRKYHPNIIYIKQAVKSIAGNIKKGALVILESTTYPGTTEEVILPIFEQSGLIHGKDFFLSFSPERIDPGNSQYPVHKIPKVVGGINPEATQMTKLVYSRIINTVVPVSSTRVAEAAKLLENTFRLINIGLIDEMAMMAHKMGIDIWEVINAAKTKPFGFMPFYPGPGVGGHCIPKDPLYLYWKARHHGFRSRFIKLASDVISGMPRYVTERVFALLKKDGILPKKAKVLVIGVTYKKDIKDLRKSPALDIINCLQDSSVKVAYFDPLIPYLRIDRINLKCISINKTPLQNFDCVIIATDHSNLDYKLILNNSKLIFDCRNVYKGLNTRKVVRL